MIVALDLEDTWSKMDDDLMLYFVALNDWHYGGGVSNERDKVLNSRREVSRRWKNMMETYVRPKPYLKEFLSAMMPESYERARSLSCPCPEQCPHDPAVIFSEDFERIAIVFFVRDK